MAGFPSADRAGWWAWPARRAQRDGTAPARNPRRWRGDPGWPDCATLRRKVLAPQQVESWTSSGVPETLSNSPVLLEMSHGRPSGFRETEAKRGGTWQKKTVAVGDTLRLAPFPTGYAASAGGRGWGSWCMETQLTSATRLVRRGAALPDAGLSFPAWLLALDWLAATRSFTSRRARSRS